MSNCPRKSNKKIEVIKLRKSKGAKEIRTTAIN